MGGRKATRRDCSCKEDRVQYTYDQQGRVTKQTYEDGDTVTYKYDNTGALATVADSTSGRTTTYYYDLTDRLMKYVEKETGLTHTVSYTYDSHNNLTASKEKINTGDNTFYYQYDEWDRLTRFDYDAGSKLYTYDVYNRVKKEETKHSGSLIKTDSYSYNGLSGQILTHTVAADGTKAYNYTYDANGNITSITSGGKTTRYTYDTANQLLREDNQAAGYTWVYTYDNAGNILTRKEYAYTTAAEPSTTPTTVTYTYGNSTWGDLLTAYDGQTITYDTIGNPLTFGSRSYTWEHGRQLASLTENGTTWSYTYGADGLRTGKTNGTSNYTYLYKDGKLTYMGGGGRNLYFSYDGSGKPYAMWYGTTNYYYVTNLQGDVIGILDNAGNQIVTYTYDAWGNILSITGTHASTIGQYNPLRYRGYIYDSETGLYYVSSRYYDPEIGRWINADSIIGVDDILGNNLFAYCDNNSVNKVDYSGKDGQTIDLGNGWKYRIDPLNTNTKTKRHIHIWNEKKEYIQNDDGSSHDDHRGESGKIPKWLNNKLIEKAGWDYNGKRKDFFEQTSFECWVEGTQYTFADGTTVFQPYNPYLPTRYSVDSFEGVYFQGDIASSGASNTTQTFYLPIIGPVTFPSFSFGFGWGSFPIPLLY